jgi:hypothetical protein
MVVSWVSGVKKTNIMPEMNAKAIPNLIGNIIGKSSPIFHNIPPPVMNLKIVSWNVRGINDARKRTSIGNLLKRL